MIISVIVPVYNEINTLQKVIEKIKAVPLEKEIIIVDDFSADGTRELLKKEYSQNNDNIKLLFHEHNKGKGSCIEIAQGQVSGDYVIIQDADLEYDPNDYIALINAAGRENADVVYGSRFLGKRNTSLFHYLVNKFFTNLTNLLFGSSLTDMETCYKIIKTPIFKELKIESSRFEVEAEVTAKLLKNKHKIIEVPISYKRRLYSEGKKITWKDGVVTLLILLKYKFKK